jgi:FtsP/CotA-like multicopper oxidase with cupredoxin domain
MNAISKTPENHLTGTVPSRRRFMASALASAIGLSLADVTQVDELAAAPQALPPSCSKVGDPFAAVREFASKNKALSVNMTVKATTRNVATIADQGYQCRSMKLRYYEAQEAAGGVKWPEVASRLGPGPTFRVRVGDTVKIHLVNSIDPAFIGGMPTAKNGCDLKKDQNLTEIYPVNDDLVSCFHGDNVTNLHYHGTHVTPDGKGDNVMVDVYPVGHPPASPPTPPPPQTVWSEFTNDFKIPLPPPESNSTDFTKPFSMGQAPGTHWYHAHKHGAVALQLLNGMAGAFIIEGEFDDQLRGIPGLHGLTEKVLVIQQLGDVITIQSGTPMNTCAGGNPRPLVNGQLQPTITMRPGEIQRWRIINATMQQVSHLTYSFTGAPSSPGYAPTIRQIAYDGVQLARERYNDPACGLAQQFTLAPANRIDILVQAPATAGESLLSFQLLHGPPPAGCPAMTPVDLFLLKLNVDGSAVSPAMSFPTAAEFPAMPAWLQWDESDPRNKISLKTRTLRFNNTNDKSLRPAIDGLAFDDKDDTTQFITLNTAEEWLLENYWASSIHPFHIHVNPFQVLEIFDPNATTQVKLQAPYNWHDTIAIPAAKDNGDGTTTNGWVKIRSRFVDFPGTFVLHCHILDHEDRGMMQRVEIEDPKAKTSPPPAMHH